MRKKTVYERLENLRDITNDLIAEIEKSPSDESVKQEIEPGTIVWAWDDDERSGRPVIGYYTRRTESHTYPHEVDVYGGPGLFKHVEPYRAPIRWDKIHYADDVVFYDSGAVIPRIDSCNTIGEVSDVYGTVIAIEHRPREEASDHETR